jgi:Zn-dependent protease
MGKDVTPRLGLWILALKLGAKLLPALGKVLGLAVKTKGGLAALSFAGYSFMFTWQFAVVIMVSLGIHEAGHVWAMRRCGIPTKGFYFIPFFGGAAVPDRTWRTQKEHLYVALMGPIWGILVALPCIAAFLVTGNVLWAGIASWVAAINLINLLPIYPLDGGRVLHSVMLPSKSRAQLFSFIALSLGMGTLMAYVGIYLFAYMSLIGLLQLSVENRKMESDLANAKEANQLKEMVATQRKRLEIISPGVFDRLGRLSHHERAILRAGFDEKVSRAKKSESVSHIADDTATSERDDELQSDLDDDSILEEDFELRYLEHADNLEKLQQDLEETFQEVTTLEALTYPQRALGLLSFFLLAIVLAGLVSTLAGVDGAEAALKAFQ